MAKTRRVGLEDLRRVRLFRRLGKEDLGRLELETDMHRHIHLENNVLFPRAQALEAELTGVPA